MYEKFTDRARKVMQLANQEAQRFNHEVIGTEHVLLGLAKEGGGVGANVLKNLDIDLRKIRREIERIVQSGPEIVMGKLPQTPQTKNAIAYAIEEARNLNHDYIGTEHLLLGLLHEKEHIAAQILVNLGTTLEAVREEVLNLLNPTPEAEYRKGVHLPAFEDKTLSAEGQQHLVELLKQSRAKGWLTIPPAQVSTIRSFVQAETGHIVFDATDNDTAKIIDRETGKAIPQQYELDEAGQFKVYEGDRLGIRRHKRPFLVLSPPKEG
jgi:ATP-dependent Clp protease ATP-binding subunit ClpA